MSTYQVFNPKTGQHESYDKLNDAAEVLFNYTIELIQNCGPEVLQQQEVVQEGNTHTVWASTGVKNQLIGVLKTANTSFLKVV